MRSSQSLSLYDDKRKNVRDQHNLITIIVLMYCEGKTDNPGESHADEIQK